MSQCCPEVQRGPRKKGGPSGTVHFDHSRTKNRVQRGSYTDEEHMGQVGIERHQQQPSRLNQKIFEEH